MADVAHAASAAKRRRERRLRGMLRHERRSVAMALAEFTQHSSRGQRTARAWGTRRTTAYGHRRLHLRGERPGCLSDPGPQRSDRTVRHSAGVAPSLLLPSLAAADVVDHSSLAFLLKESLSQRRKEEEEAARKVEMEQVLAVKEQWRARRKVLKDEFMALMDLPSLTPLQVSRTRELVEAMDAHDASKPSSGSSRRKRKKRRKRKLPKAGCRLFPPGCRRLCDHQRQVPAVSPQTLGIPVTMQRQVPTVHSFMLPVQFLDTVLDMPVVVLRQVPGLMVQKTVVRPQLQSIEGRRHSLSFSRGSSPWSSLFTRPQRFSSCCSISGSRCPCCAGRAVSPVLPWRRSWRSHSCSSLRNRRPFFADSPQLQFIMVVDIPFVPHTQILMVQTILQTTEFPQLQYFPGGRCSCWQVVQFLRCWATIVLSLSADLVLVIWARIAFSLSLAGAGVHCRLRLRRRGQGLRSRFPWFGACVHSCRGAETAPLVCLFS